MFTLSSRHFRDEIVAFTHIFIGKTFISFPNSSFLNYLFVCFLCFIRFSMNVLVGSSGLEPPTSRLSAECSNQLSYGPIRFSLSWFFLSSLTFGGDEGNRTPDPLLAGQVLSQLSYTPITGSLYAPWKLNNDQESVLRISTSSFLWVSLFQNLIARSHQTFVCESPVLHRKEVIQPHLPIRLPCYDLTPITGPTFGHALLAVRLWTSGVSDFHGLTGGVYKARERIHRGMLIRDY